VSSSIIGSLAGRAERPCDTNKPPFLKTKNRQFLASNGRSMTSAPIFLAAPSKTRGAEVRIFNPRRVPDRGFGTCPSGLQTRGSSFMDDEFQTAGQYRAKADEIRATAAETKDPSIRQMLLRIALDYELMANALQEIAEARAARTPRSNTD
jgi:hypothetical protein